MQPEWGEVGPPYWPDKPVLIVGAGGSLKGFDFNRLNGLGHILAVKEAAWDLPFADACFGLDLPWIKRRQNELSRLTMQVYLSVPVGMREDQYTIVPNAIYLDRIRVTNTLSTNPKKIESGGNSGFGAVNLAFLKKAKTIYLFGFDYSPSGGHYCPDRYNQPVNHNARYWPRWGDNFINIKDQIAVAGVTIINASPESTVKAFPKVSIAKAMDDLLGRRAQGV